MLITLPLKFSGKGEKIKIESFPFIQCNNFGLNSHFRSAPFQDLFKLSASLFNDQVKMGFSRRLIDTEAPFRNKLTRHYHEGMAG